MSWDDWGGFYDHVVPPRVDQNGYGLRVPALTISPYAKRGYIDHQTLSSDAYLKFIEDDFLDGARLNPQTDGRPDPRPDVRENAADPGQHRNRVQLQPGAPPAGAAGHQPAHRLAHDPGLLHRPLAVRRVHHAAAGPVPERAERRHHKHHHARSDKAKH